MLSVYSGIFSGRPSPLGVKALASSGLHVLFVSRSDALRPLPEAWMLYAAELIAHPSDDEDDLDAAVEALAGVGLVSLEN